MSCISSTHNTNSAIVRFKIRSRIQMLFPRLFPWMIFSNAVKQYDACGFSNIKSLTRCYKRSQSHTTWHIQVYEIAFHCVAHINCFHGRCISTDEGEIEFACGHRFLNTCIVTILSQCIHKRYWTLDY